jgi:histidinol dehydrogenase
MTLAHPRFVWSVSADDPVVSARLQPLGGGLPASALEAARRILDGVRTRGDDALIAFTRQFDGVSLRPDTLRVELATIEASAAEASPALREAIALAATRIRTWHARQLPADDVLEDPLGGVLRRCHRPVSAAGLYVPGGRAAYPSTVLMNVIPAQVAGVPRLAVFTVPGMVESNPAVAFALHHLGVEEVWRVAGAQAIGAAAFGTATIAPVDVIVGPGNAFVAAAKREVQGLVGIDSIAGPSEVLILCDHTAEPGWMACDMLAQAEHDPLARVVVACTDADTLDRILDAFAREIAASPRRAVVEAAWRDHGLALLVDEVAGLEAIARRMAAEHLQVVLADPGDVTRFPASAIFVGNRTPTALGDYILGTNHVLPTGGASRFSGPLGVHAFLRHLSVAEVTGDALLASIAEPGALFADHEGLAGHARALRVRIPQTPEEGP